METHSLDALAMRCPLLNPSMVASGRADDGHGQHVDGARFQILPYDNNEENYFLSGKGSGMRFRVGGKFQECAFESVISGLFSAFERATMFGTECPRCCLRISGD